MKKIILPLITLLLLTSCNNTNENNEATVVNNNDTKIEKVNVTTSIIPLASITNYIGGDFIEAKSLVPSGVSPHGFDLKPNQMIDIEKSDLIVHLGMEHVDGFINKAIENKNNVLSVNKGIDLLVSEGHDDHDHGDEHSEGHNDEHEEHGDESLEHICEKNGGKFIEEHNECEGISKANCDEANGKFNECASACRNDPNAEICTMQCVLVCSDEKEGHHDEDEHHDDHDMHEKHDEHEEESHSTDPHIWGNGENAYIIAKTILDELVKLSPNNKEYFESNLESFKNELGNIKNEFETNPNTKTQSNFIVFHDAYNYLFKELNIDNSKKHIFKNNMLSDPNSNEMKELVDEITHEGIKVAYKEPQLGSSNLNNVSKEYNLEILVLDPLGTDESSNGYLNNYKNNLKTLEKIYE